MHWAANDITNEAKGAAFIRREFDICPFAWMDGIAVDTEIRDINTMGCIITG